MKRISSMLLCAVVVLAYVSTTFAIDLVDVKKAPTGFARMVKQGDKEVLVFDSVIAMYGPATLDKILSAYGLTIQDPRRAPTGFARVVKQGDKEAVVFDNAITTYSPATLNQILSAYSRGFAER